MPTEPNTDVKVAIELLSSTLEKELPGILGDCVQAFSSNPSSQAQAILEAVAKFQRCREMVQELSRRWDELQQLLGQKAGGAMNSAKQTGTAAVASGTAAQGLRVIFPTGAVICLKNDSDTFEEAIHLIGAARVMSLDFQSRKCPLVTRVKPSIADLKHYKEWNGFYVFTYSSTPEKAGFLSAISMRLNLGLKIDF